MGSISKTKVPFKKLRKFDDLSQFSNKDVYIDAPEPLARKDMKRKR